jgi:hypothetical protein
MPATESFVWNEETAVRKTLCVNVKTLLDETAMIAGVSDTEAVQHSNVKNLL